MQLHDSVFTDNLAKEPSHHPDCCVAISRPLLVSLLDLLPKPPSLVLSIGSGTGYLEASLLQIADNDSLNLVGVEVSPSVNKYLPEEHFDHVNGTWELYAGAATAELLLFVYPREPRLVARYLDHFCHTSVKTVVWIGPALDWPDYKAVLMSSDFASITTLRDCGAAEYEMVSVATKRQPQ